MWYGLKNIFIITRIMNILNTIFDEQCLVAIVEAYITETEESIIHKKLINEFKIVFNEPTTKSFMRYVMYRSPKFLVGASGILRKILIVKYHS